MVVITSTNSGFLVAKGLAGYPLVLVLRGPLGLFDLIRSPFGGDILVDLSAQLPKLFVESASHVHLSQQGFVDVGKVLAVCPTECRFDVFCPLTPVGMVCYL